MKRTSIPAWCRNLLLGVGIALGVASVAHAQSYPSRPVRLVVPFPPGGATDVVARLIAQELSQMWPQPVVVENIAGAGGTIGTDRVAKSVPDGYTLLFATLATNATAPSVYSKLPYDPQRDFTYLAPISTTTNVLVVNPKLPVNSVRELIDYARANKNQMTYSSPGTGLSGHLGMEMFLAAAGIEALNVPYKGAAPATLAVISGEVMMSLDPSASALSHVRAGKVKALAVLAPKRSPLLPDVPTIDEAGVKGVEVYTWNGLAAPTGTPTDVTAKISRDMTALLNKPEMRDKLVKMGADPLLLSPAEFEKFIRSEAKKWGDIVKRTGVKLD